MKKLIAVLIIIFVGALAEAQESTDTSTTLPKPTEASISRPMLIDVHSHLPRGLTLEHLVKIMDENGIVMTVVMPTHYGGNKPDGQGISDENLVLDYYKKRPDRIIPFMGMQRPLLLDKKLWEQPDASVERLLRFTESQLSTGLFKGIGEFILRHYRYLYASGAQGQDINIPADTPLMKKFLDLAAKYNVPVNVHYEIDAETLPSLKRMLEYGQRNTIILAHNGGRADMPTLKALLNEFPNVFIDWAGMTRFGGYGLISPPPQGKGYIWFVKNPIEDGSGNLRPEWKVFAEQYQDRIVGIGFDGAHTEHYRSPEVYKRHMEILRSMVTGLSPETAQKIGFKNAQRLFGAAGAR
jgi:Tat protein secretion system quality control protein TatD with DNase activity